MARDHGESFQAAREPATPTRSCSTTRCSTASARKAQQPEDWVVVGTPMSSEAYGCMMRRGDIAFKRSSTAALARLMTSGEALKIYAKWFQRPIPPNGLNLNWPPLGRAARALPRAERQAPADATPPAGARRRLRRRLLLALLIAGAIVAASALARLRRRPQPGHRGAAGRVEPPARPVLVGRAGRDQAPRARAGHDPAQPGRAGAAARPGGARRVGRRPTSTCAGSTPTSAASRSSC